MSGLVGLGVFVVAFATYAWTASPVAGWLDSAELIAASASLGVPHSPGHPLPTMLGHIAQLLPFGDIVVRVTLASALVAAGAAAALHRAAVLLLARTAPGLDARPRTIIAVAAALGFAFSWAAWFQAVRAEVYALQALLLLVALAALLAESRRGLLVAGFAVGLALANHHFVATLFFLPAAAVTLLVRSARPTARIAGMTALLGVLALAAFLYLPLRAARDPEVNWGDPRTASRLVWTVSAQAFQKSLAPEQSESRIGEAGQVTAAVAEQISPAALLAALAGAWLLLRRRELRAVGLLLAGVAVTVVAGVAILGFDPDNPDAHGYLLPALAALLLLAAAAAAELAQALAARAATPSAARAAPLLVGALALALAPAQLVTHARAASLRDAHAADAYAREALDDLPPRALLITSFYETTFQAWALRAVEGARPDVTVVDRNFLGWPGFAAAATRRSPELALILAGLRPGRPTPIAEVARVAATRPILVELHFNLDEAVLPYLVPDGVSAWFQSPPPDAATRAPIEARDARRARRLEDALAGEAGGRRLLTWQAFLRARHYCFLGRAGAAAAALEQLRRVDPGDPAVDELAAHCSGGRLAPSP